MEALILNDMAGESVQERFVYKFYSFRFCVQLYSLPVFSSLYEYGLLRLTFILRVLHRLNLVCNFDEHNFTFDLRKAEEKKKVD